MSNDIAIGITASLPTAGAMSKKPVYLITLEKTGNVTKRFLTLDKPESLNGFVQAKGIYSDSSEDEISKNFSDILTNAKKESIIEIYFPLHKISSMRSLVFKAK